MKRIGMLVLSLLILWASLFSTSCVQRIETNDRQPSESQSSDPATRAPGLYKTGTGELVRSWDELVYEKYIIKPTGEPNDDLKWMLAGDLYLPYGIEVIRSEWFDHCIQLTAIILPDSVTRLDDGCFEWCSNLQYIDLGKGVTSIPDDAFFSCTALKTVVMSDAVTSFGKRSFYGCVNLVDLAWPAALTTISDYAFVVCRSLKELPSLEKLESIGAYAFSGCESLKEIPFLERLESIGQYAFNGCDSLTTVHRLPALKKVDTALFYKCTALTSIHWSENMELPDLSFYNQSMKIYLDTATVSLWFGLQGYRDCTFYVPCGEAELQFEEDGTYNWSEFKERNTFVYHYNG